MNVQLCRSKKELVRLHGGTLSVNSTAQVDDEDEHGSTFTVNIPMGHAHIPKAYVEEAPLSTVGHRTYARGIIDEAAQYVRLDPFSFGSIIDFDLKVGPRDGCLYTKRHE